MPADRSLAEDLAQPLLEIYSGLEARLTADMARRLRADLGRDDWAERKAQAAGEIANLIRRLLAKLAADLDGRVAQQLTLAYARGGHNALNELTNLALRPGRHEGLPSAAEAMMRAPDVQLGEMRRIAAGHHSNVIRGLNNLRSSYPGADSVMRMTWSLSSRLKGTHLPVLRWSEDAYRQTIAAAALPDVLLGVATRRRASQVAWEDLLSKGITGFVDNADRRWNLATYVEMATRTGVAQAAVEGHMDRLEGAGIDLVIVSNAALECYRCRPWEGKVLARRGPEGARDIEVEHSTEDGRMVTVHIAGSVDEAIGKGLMHPQCFPGHVLVSAPSGIRAADARWYEGDLVVVHTAAGHELPVTPNHPVLTPEGWVAAGLLQIGQDVLSYSVNHQRMMPFDASMRPGDEQVPTPIGEVFDALRQAGPASRPRTVPRRRVLRRCRGCTCSRPAGRWRRHPTRREPR